MRTKMIGIAMGCMLVLLAGCADTTVNWNETEPTPTAVTEQKADKVRQDAGEDAVVPLSEEPEVTPTKIVETMNVVVPPATDYFTRQQLTIFGKGEYTYMGTAPIPNEDGSMCIGVETVQKNCTYEVHETKNGDGTKTIVATICDYPHAFENGWLTLSYYAGIIDRQTGIGYTPAENGTVDLVFQRSGEDIKLSLTTERIGLGQQPFASCTFTVTCPEDYDDAIFYLTGNESMIHYTEELMDRYRSVIYLKQGQSDLLFFH